MQVKERSSSSKRQNHHIQLEKPEASRVCSKVWEDLETSVWHIKC